MQLLVAALISLIPVATPAAEIPTRDLVSLIERCAPDVHPQTMLAVKQECSGNPAAININRWTGRNPTPDTVADVAALATKLIAEGRNIDMGLGQMASFGPHVAPGGTGVVG